MLAEQNPQQQREIIDRLLTAADARTKRQQMVRDMITRGVIGGGSAVYP
jgi:hypothetical protein